ncbi:MAG: ferritin-like domain-containing protein [Verrucomicrobiaceae bacterium]|nr:ferritin-like domain-containing protein [Verrucomicrobiaceae bacterium]
MKQLQVREVAERVLFSSSLEEKLSLAPGQVVDDVAGQAMSVPESPGRPDGLQISPKGTRGQFPGIHRIGEERERGILLHFLANHELLATELMALALLRFPDAPREYRAGVYSAMREEQVHTQLYLRRMRECGVEFGQLPLNNYFWRLIASVDSLMDFVTRLNLTFEQANLDFSRHYAALFREAGDSATAVILEKIYRDEIGHVGHGIKWFRRWKDQEDTDWQAFDKQLTFPFSPVRAKGLAPFNREGRLLAGLDEDFISNLEICEQSRGRTPVVHWFNPNAESHAMRSAVGTSFDANRFQNAMEHDLEMLMISWSRRDDIILMRRPPSREHLQYLREVGLHVPEVVGLGKVDNRKLGGLRPWAWSPDAVDALRPYAAGVSERVDWQWRDDFPAEWFSKEIGLCLEQVLGVSDDRAVVCRNVESAMALSGEGTFLFKAAYACAGRGHRRSDRDLDGLRRWLGNVISGHGCVIAEPWLERVMDFSALYEVKAGRVDLVGMTRIENDASGRFRGISVAPKWSKLLGEEVAEFLFSEVQCMQWYERKIPEAIADLLPGYCGPVGVDAMVHRRSDGTLALRHVVELNVRMTMGRVALELQKKLAPSGWGNFQVLRKDAAVRDGAIIINDPGHAGEFIAVWEAGQEKSH